MLFRSVCIYTNWWTNTRSNQASYWKRDEKNNIKKTFSIAFTAIFFTPPTIFYYAARSIKSFFHSLSTTTSTRIWAANYRGWQCLFSEGDFFCDLFSCFTFINKLNKSFNLLHMIEFIEISNSYLLYSK